MKSCETRNLWLLAPALAIYGSGACATTSHYACIRQLPVQQADAWNRHDAAAYAALFTEDGDCVNVLGWWWKGRAAIEKQLTAAFAFVFHESRLSIAETTVRHLTRDVAVAHVRWTMSGAKTPPGMPEPKEGIQTQVLQKVAGRWL